MSAGAVLKGLIALLVATVLVLLIASCHSDPAPLVVAQPAPQVVQPQVVQAAPQIVQAPAQPVYVQPQASTHDGLVEGMILGHMMSGGGGGYGRAPTVVNRTTIINRRPAYRSSGRRR